MISDQKDRISSIKLSKVKLPLLKSISDAKVIQGKQAPVEEIIEKAHQSRSRGIAGVKIKIGQDDVHKDYQRVAAVRKSLGDEVPIMVDVNQQWKRKEALNNCLLFSDLGLTWIEEPLDAHDFGGHAQLSARVNTPIATGEMLSSAREHFDLMNQRGADIVQPDAPRVGGIKPFLKVASEAERLALGLAPHFVMEIHIHLADTGNPVVQKKLADIADMCNKINAPVGILATGGPDGQKYFDMGYTFVGMGSDSGLFRNATSALAQSFK